MPNININSLRENTFYFTLLLYVSVLSFSEAFVSISAGLLLVQAILLTSWKHPSVKLHNHLSLLMVTSIFGVYLLGMLITEDLPFALYEIKKVVFWFVLPVAFFISPRLTLDRFYRVLFVFCLAVFTASVVTIIRLLFKDYFQINEFRDITLITHIRYSFQVVLSIIIATCFLLSGDRILQFKHGKILIYFFLVWIIGVLFILKSITGIMVFIGTAVLLLLLLVIRLQSKKLKVVVLFIIVLFVSTPVIYIANVWNSFYNVEKLEPQKVNKFTESGNPYTFDFSSKKKENGHWVNAFICEEELRKEWNNKSEMKYDSIDANGYPYSITLIRYLTSKGLRKDSAGVNELIETDIRAIENGIANHIFVKQRFSIYPRIYETIWELDRYLESGNPNFQSFSQRIEFVKASLLLIKKNLWLGIGTGNWKIKYAETYKEMNSQLLAKNQGPSHNQYLNYLVKFGVIGFIYIFSMLIIPIFRERHKNNLVFWLFLAAMAIANLADANFETHMGLSFFCFFYCFFLWHSPDKFRTFRLL